MTGALQAWLRGVWHNPTPCNHVMEEYTTDFGSTWVWKCNKCGTERRLTHMQIELLNKITLNRFILTGELPHGNR